MNSIKLVRPAFHPLFDWETLTSEQAGILRDLLECRTVMDPSGQIVPLKVDEFTLDYLCCADAAFSYLASIGHQADAVSEIDVDGILTLARNFDELDDFTHYLRSISQRNNRLRHLLRARRAPAAVLIDMNMINRELEHLWLNRQMSDPDVTGEDELDTRVRMSLCDPNTDEPRPLRWPRGFDPGMLPGPD